MASVTDIWGLQPALDGKAPKRHNHKVSDIDGLKDTLLSIQNAIFEGQATEPILISSIQGLSNALDGKAPTVHGHTIDQITGLTNALNALAEGIGEKAAASHSHGNATTSTAGFMSAADKAKLDGLSTSGGASTIAQVDGLQTALDSKAATDHSHGTATTSTAGFMSAADKTKLDGLSTNGGASTIAQVQGLQAALDGKASTAHTHAGLLTLSPALLTYTISQSTLYPGVTAGSYANLTDGLFTTGTGTNYTGGPEWIKADMGSIQTLAYISVAGGAVSGFGDTTSMLSTAAVEVSEDDTNWIIVVPSLSRIVNNARTRFALGRISGRYLRIWRSGNNLGLTELGIFG